MPLHVKRRTRPTSSSQSASQTQPDVATVRGAVVEHAEQVELTVLQGERAEHLVGAGRVLDQQQGGGAPVQVERLGAAERGRDRLQAGDDVVERDAEGQRQRGRAERVVDVVEAGQRELDLTAHSSPAGWSPLAEQKLSLGIAIVLFLTYFCVLGFSLRTDKYFFQCAEEAVEESGRQWSRGRALLILLISTAVVALLSEFLVGTIENVRHSRRRDRSLYRCDRRGDCR